MKYKNIYPIFLLAFFLRIIFLLLAPERPMTLDDAISWNAVAWNFLNGNGFTEIDGSPTTIRAPLYPMFLSFVYFLFGRNYLMVKIFQALIGAMSCAAIFLLAKKIFNKRIAFFSAVGCALWPALIVYVGIIGSETLFTFLLIFFILFLTKAYTENSQKYYLLGGVILGLANLTRSTLFFYPLFLIVFILLFEKEWKKKISSIGMIFLISGLIVLPWTIRNYNVFGRFLLINTGAGELFWSGTYVPWDGICKHGRDEHFYNLFNLKNPVDNERKMFQEGLKNIKENPLGFVKLSIKKFSRFWFKPIGQELTEKKYYILGKLLFLPQIILTLLFLYGIITFYIPLLLPIVTIFIYFGVMHNLLAPLTRYRLPLEPLFIVFAVAGLSKLVTKLLNMRKLSSKVIKGKNCKINPTANLGVISPRVEKILPLIIGDNAEIRSNVIIYAGTIIGNNLQTGYNVVIREENKIGDNFQIWNNSVIDYSCEIGNNVKIHSNCYIAQYTMIEDNVFLAPGVIIANDPHPGCKYSKKCMRGPTIKRGAQIGCNVTILPFVTIGKNSLIGAGSVVTKDIPENSVAYGNPAKVKKKISQLRCPLGITDRPYKQNSKLKI